MTVTSKNGLVAIARHEGIVPAPYLDSAGVWTFGIGHAETSGLPPNPRLMPRGMPSDVAAVLPEAFKLFRARIQPYEAGVRNAVKVPVAQHEFDALVSLCFNIGPGGLAGSSVIRHLNAGNRAAAADAFRAWNKHRDGAGKLVVSAGLVRRRAEERALFLTGEYPSGSVPVYSVDATGRLGRVIDTMSEAQVLRAVDAAPARQPSHVTSPPPPPNNPLADLWAAIVAILRRKK
jgi:lysozyme